MRLYEVTLAGDDDTFTVHVHASHADEAVAVARRRNRARVIALRVGYDPDHGQTLGAKLPEPEPESRPHARAL